MTSRGVVARLLALALSVSPMAWSTDVIAEPTTADRETARGLMTEGDTAFDAKDYKKALRKYEQAHALVDLPSTGIWVVKAHEKLGELIDAREAALEVGRIPPKPNEKQAQTDARKEAEDLSASLARRIPTLLVTVDGVPDGASFGLEIDGETIRPDLAGVPRKVDPGSHSIRVSSTKFDTVETSADVPEGGPTTFPVHIAATVPKGPEPETTRPSMVGASGRHEVQPPESSWWSGLRIGGFVTGGIGVALTGVGAGLVGYGETCPSGQNRFSIPLQSEVCVEAPSSAGTQVSLLAGGGALVGVGGASLVAGIVMIAVAPRATTAGAGPHARFLMVPWADGKTRGVGLVGTF